MKATTLLEKQHRKVEAIFKRLESGRTGAAALLAELADDLAAHMAIEQDIFYPAIRSVDEKLVLESYEEHSLAELAIKRLLAGDGDTDDGSFTARVNAAKELIAHHVKEEEEELFPKVEKAFDDAKLTELGARMKARFEQVVAAGFEASVPKTFERTSADLSKKTLKKAS